MSATQRFHLRGLWVIAVLAGGASQEGCSPVYRARPCTLVWPVPHARTTEIGPVRAAASLMLVADGVRHELDVSILTQGDTMFVADIYGPMGVHVATLQRGSAGGRVTAERMNTDVQGEAAVVTVLAHVWPLPFTFDDVVRILRGTYVGTVAPYGAPDTVTVSRRKSRAVWRFDTLRCELVTRARSCKVRAAIVESMRRDGGWRLEFVDFRGSLPGVVRLTVDDRNYFVLRHRFGE